VGFECERGGEILDSLGILALVREGKSTAVKYNRSGRPGESALQESRASGQALFRRAGGALPVRAVGMGRERGWHQQRDRQEENAKFTACTLVSARLFVVSKPLDLAGRLGRFALLRRAHVLESLPKFRKKRPKRAPRVSATPRNEAYKDYP
jgi:hypothetical protein